MEDFLVTDYENLDKKAEILKAMAHPIRLCILRGLSENDEKQVNDMKSCLNMPQSTISQHVGILKKEGLIKGRRDGVNIYYSIANDDVKNLIKVVLEEIWK